MSHPFFNPLIARDLSFATEVHFMVGQKLREPAPLDGKRKWACPANAQNPIDRILTEMTRVIDASTQEGCIKRGSEPRDETTVWEHEAPNKWLVTPSCRSWPGDQAPRGYKWHSFKLRSPFFSHQGFDAPPHTPHPFQRPLDLLQRDFLIHLNASTQFNVLVRLNSSCTDLTAAKRLVSLVWLFEKLFLVPLTPKQQINSGRALMVTENSKLAENSGNIFPQREVPVELRNTHPRYKSRNSRLEKETSDIWKAQSVQELDLLMCRDEPPARRGVPLAFSLIQAPEPATPAGHATWYAAFRYAPWHSPDQYPLRATVPWLRVLFSIVAASQLTTFQFKQFAEDMLDHMLDLIRVRATEREYLGSIMRKLALSVDERNWRTILDLYAEREAQRS
ncbi:hypothetical protein JDV02_002900 [Purpureocillium takamizusanense]|uniref:Uncharacterized protein n=1 Tax=Purpureocillium takamizusanense TaxID=2060973 RepID=A0A9Q8QBW1_9HYPO|nr:uncharacterized protein JDV02_002900 [Purpureocillium takamizusanense]UNI16468.1 hypothetical protein JDV02_002900 [Purpureocillium takamizusanense]